MPCPISDHVARHLPATWAGPQCAPVHPQKLSRGHTHLLILAIVVSATRTKSSAGESCTPLGNRNWSSKTFTSLVSVSYSSRLWGANSKRSHGRVRGPCHVGVSLPSEPQAGGLRRGSASCCSDKAPGGPLPRPDSRLAPGGLPIQSRPQASSSREPRQFSR